MNNKDLLDIENLNLPSENLSEADIKEMKKILHIALKTHSHSQFETFENSFDLDNISSEDIKNPLNQKYIHGVKNSEIMKSIVLSKIDTSLSFDGFLIYKRLFKAYGNYVAPNYGTMKSAFYYYTFITSKEIIIYSLDNYFAIIKKNVYKLNNLSFFKNFKDSYCILLSFNKDNFIDEYLLYENTGFIKDELLNLSLILESLNLKNCTKENSLSEYLDERTGASLGLFLGIGTIIAIIIVLVSVIFL